VGVGVATGDGLGADCVGVLAGFAVALAVAVGGGVEVGAAEGLGVGLEGMHAVRRIGRRATARWRRRRR